MCSGLFCRNTQYIDKKAVILREENLNEENPQEENPKGENPKEENPKEENPTERGYYCCIYQSDTSGSYIWILHLDLVLHLSMMDVVQKENKRHIKRSMKHIAGTTNACDVLCCM